MKRKLDEKASSLKQKLSEELRVAIKSYGLAGITTDMWTDLKGRSSISLTVHFVGENLTLRSNVATVRQFMDTKQTGRNIRQAIENIEWDSLTMVLNICLYRYGCFGY